MTSRAKKTAVITTASLLLAGTAVVVKYSTFVAPPSGPMVILLWDYPTNQILADSNLVLVVRHSRDLNLPYANWTVLTNFPATNGRVLLPANQSYDFFIATFSNRFGESDFSRK